ncbi:MAG: hypothetical protein ACLFQV_06350 [Vulcanimicrobiota bacterium]
MQYICKKCKNLSIVTDGRKECEKCDGIIVPVTNPEGARLYSDMLSNQVGEKQVVNLKKRWKEEDKSSWGFIITILVIIAIIAALSVFALHVVKKSEPQKSPSPEKSYYKAVERFAKAELSNGFFILTEH